MKEKISIPVAVILEMDDVGWDDGRDLRVYGRASRSGLPRRHATEDFEFISKLREKTRKNIVVALCVGDWDKDNILRGRVGYTHDPYGWNRAAEINLEKTARMIEILEGEGIEYALHGVLHGLYDENGKLITEKEYFYPRENAEGGREFYLPSVEFLRERFNTFFEICNSWGIKKKIEAFVNPCGLAGVTSDSIDMMSGVLAEYGIRYWADPSFGTDGRSLTLKDGVARIYWGYNKAPLPWEAYDLDPDTLYPTNSDDKKCKCCWQGSHLTNYLRFNPKKNFEGLEAWAAFYKRQEETFGQMLAKNLSEAVAQLAYSEFADIAYEDGKYALDLTRVKKNRPDGASDQFYVSFDNSFVPREIQGGSVTLYEKHDAFCTYLVTHNSDKVIIG